MEASQAEKEALEAIQAGDRKAFRKLFDAQYKELLIAATQILKDQNAAKDAVQEVFFQLWKNRETLHITSSLAGYLKRSVINRSLNQIKSRKAFVEDTGLETRSNQINSAQEALEAAELQAVIKKELDALPERCRVIFILKRIEGYSLKEIAEKLDISPKTAENQITKALKHLKAGILPYVKKNSS